MVRRESRNQPLLLVCEGLNLRTQLIELSVPPEVLFVGERERALGRDLRAHSIPIKFVPGGAGHLLSYRDAG